jgi:hypothetical protein
MSYLLDAPRCEHLHDSGIRCGSPALRGKSFCYNHHLLHTPRLLPGQPGYQLPALESEKSVEMLVRHVLQSFHDGRLNVAQVRLYLYGIQVLAPYACKDYSPHARYVATELTPAMRRLCGEEPEPDASAGPAEPEIPVEPTGLNAIPAHHEPAPESEILTPSAAETVAEPTAVVDQDDSPERLEVLRRLTQQIKALTCMTE